MASPQRPEFHGISGGDPSQRGLRPGHPPARSRATFLVGWLIAVILIAVFFYWIAWGWGNSGGYWWHRQQSTATEAGGQPIKVPGVAVLDAANKQQFIDKNFQASNVPIQRKVSNRIYWIGANDQPPMLLVFSGNQEPANFNTLKTGVLVDVAGTVVKAPPTTDAATQWSLSEPDLAQLEKEGAYVSASQLYQTPK